MNNIIIAKTFKKDFKKIFKIEADLSKFAIKLRKSKLLNLEKPFTKYKFSFNLIEIRGVLIFETEKFYIPIFVVKKSDKKYGMNLVISNEIKNILEAKYEKIKSDIENDNFQIY
ncbi:MAG: hypothetical protein Q9M94_04730 [Candidatus Gracilibacteria bacterium]|nr:hypothetical protein [Candidatus Gracilibacteria bacterium]